MNSIEQIISLALVVVLVVLAIFFGLRQWQNLALLKPTSSLGPDDRRYLRVQVYRRLCCCFLMLVLAGFLIGSHFLQSDFSQIRAEILAQDREPTSEEKAAVWFYTGYWIFALVVLLGIIGLAAADMVATARYGLKRKRQLLSDQHTLLALEVARMRQRWVERN